MTVLEYASDLRTFFRFVLAAQNNIPFEDSESFEAIDVSGVTIADVRKIDVGMIYDFMLFCKDDRTNSAKTRARKMTALRMFFKYLTVNTKELDENPILGLDSPNMPKSLPKFLSLDESVELLDCIDGAFFERDYAIITLFLNCGLRLSELVGLNLRDIHDDGRMVIRGKGNKERTVYLNSACSQAVYKYLTVRPADGIKDRNALFISRQKNRISPKTVQHIVKKYLQKAGIDETEYSVHKLRHTAATLMYRHGDVDVLQLKEILGHSNLATTQIYTHVADEQIRKAIESNPLSKIKEKGKPNSSDE